THVPLVFGVLRVFLDDHAGDFPGFRVPTNVVADVKLAAHDRLPFGARARGPRESVSLYSRRRPYTRGLRRRRRRRVRGAVRASRDEAVTALANVHEEGPMCAHRATNRSEVV